MREAAERFPASVTPAKDLGKDDRLVVLFVTRAIKQRGALAADQRPQRLEWPRSFRELGAIAAAKLRPARGIMAEPPAKRGARRDILQPMIDLGLFFTKPPRPDAIDQHPHAILVRRWVID